MGSRGERVVVQRWAIALTPILLPLFLLAVWAIVSGVGLAPRVLLPTPAAAFSRLATLLGPGGALPDIAATLRRWALGFVAGCLVGVPLGLALGGSRRVFRATFPSVDFFRSLPVTALFPLFLLLFGIGDTAKVAMAFAATLPVVALNSAYGVVNARQARIRAARVFGATRFQIFRWVLFFEALPQTLVGVRTAVSLALIVVIVSEMFIGTKAGLGQRIFDAYTTNFTEELYAVLLIVGMLGYVLNVLFVQAERRLVPWAGK